MDQRLFMPDGETFYCSTECIHKKVKQVRKSLTHRDQIFVTDRRGRLHANYVPDIDSLESFLLRRPSYEPCVKVSTDEDPKASPPSMSSTADDSRVRIRNTFSDQIIKRCTFHDIEISEKKAKELSHQVEYDLFEFLKSVRDVRYRNWCRCFLKFLMNSTSVFMEKLVNGTADTARLVRIPDQILDRELHKMDEIEAAVETPVKSEDSTPLPSVSTSVIEKKPKPSPLSFPFKYRSEPLKTSTNQQTKPVEPEKLAIDIILGEGNASTTSSHMNHLYDKNCEICKNQQCLKKVKKNKQEKEREKGPKRNGSREDLSIERNSSFNRFGRTSSRFESTTTFKQQTKVSKSSNRHNFSDDDASPAGFVIDEDFEPPPPGHTPDFKQDTHRSANKSARKNHVSESSFSNKSNFESSRKRRRSRSPLSPFYGGAPSTGPQLSSVDSNRISPVEFRRESWRQPNNRPQISPEPEPIQPAVHEMELILTSTFDFPNKYRFNCEFSLVKNRLAAGNLQKIMPETLRVQGSIDCKSVWVYLDSLKKAWTKEIITLLMYPPEDKTDYADYTTLYTFLETSKRMTVIDVKNCLDLKDVYLHALPAQTPLHPSCDVGDGPGLSPIVQQSGNIIAIIVKHSGKRSEVRSSRKLKEKSPFAEKPVLNQKLREEDQQVLTSASFLSEIPIVGKSPFDSTSEKSPSASVHSFNMEDPLPAKKFKVEPFLNDILSRDLSPIPPPPPINPEDDRMEMSDNEEGQISPESSRSFQEHKDQTDMFNFPACIPPPPPAPQLSSTSFGHPFHMNEPMMSVPVPLPYPQAVPAPQGLPMPQNMMPLNGRPPLPPQRIHGMPPARRPMLRLNTPMNRGRMPMRMPNPRMQGPPRMMMPQGAQGVPHPRLGDSNMAVPMSRGRLPHPGPPLHGQPYGQPPLRMPPRGLPFQRGAPLPRGRMPMRMSEQPRMDGPPRRIRPLSDLPLQNQPPKLMR
ncbi:hypothetical protein M3Y97_00262200 [Aphelenchoides bicaudatus]|nr:hypothetical protein M3Y97_00262200 [Aphelenchoides bicaudatus]